MSQIIKVGIDADGTLYDLITPWLNKFSEKTNQPKIDVSRIVEYNPHLCLGENGTILSSEEEKILYSILDEPELFVNLPLYEGAKEAMYKLYSDKRIQLYIVSAPNGPVSAEEKLIAFNRDFPYIDKKHIILMHHKHLLDLDVMVDDSTKVIEQFSSHTLRLGLVQPWNQKDYTRWHNLVDGYTNTKRAWDIITEIIFTYRSMRYKGFRGHIYE